MTRGDRSFQRLDRRLAHATGLGRVRAQRAIRAGEVLVDGQPVVDPATPVPNDACLEHAGQRVAIGPRYYMLHKPAGVVCATRDRLHRTVLDLLDVPNPGALHIAGRLDLDATGLVLITDDGDWSHHVTSPRHKLPKTYRVWLAGPLTPVAAQQLRQGVQLRGEPKPCAPASLEVLSVEVVRLTIREGRYHQVKRMFAAVGNHVERLHRERIGDLVLDPGLAPGTARLLTDAEITAIRSEAESGSEGTSREPP